MATFLLAFILLGLVFAGMAIGVILSGKTIKGSCGGLNALPGQTHCSICNQEIDPNNPVREKIDCGRV